MAEIRGLASARAGVGRVLALNLILFPPAGFGESDPTLRQQLPSKALLPGSCVILWHGPPAGDLAAVIGQISFAKQTHNI